MPGWPRIHERVDPPVEVVEHMRGGGRAGAGKEIGAGRGHWNPGPPDQFQSHRVRRHSHPHQGAASSHHIGHGIRARQKQRQRTWPEGLHQLPRRLGDLAHQALQHRLRAIFPGHVHDHRIPRRPLFCLENAAHRIGIQGIRAQSINRLGGQRHQSSGAQNPRRTLQRFLGLGRVQMRRVHHQSQCLHPSIVASLPRRPPPAVYSL